MNACHKAGRYTPKDWVHFIKRRVGEVNTRGKQPEKLLSFLTKTSVGYIVMKH